MLKGSLTDQRYLTTLLGRAGHTPARSAGQNYLICEEVVDAISAVVTPGPRAVTELGAGIGPVTVRLLGLGKTVRAIERDAALTAILRDHVPAAQRPSLNLQEADLKTVDWTWAEPYQIVGNIPYNLSGYIIRRLTQLEPAPTQVTLLLQHEVGQRLGASPPDFYLLSLAVQLWAHVTPLLSVPADCFWPAPKVSSQLVLLEPAATALPREQREAIIAFAKPLFQQRRKQIKTTLAQAHNLSPSVALELLQRLGVPPTARPQEVTAAQWQELSEAVTGNR